MDLSNKDVKNLETRFTDNGVLAIDFKVVSMQPGSNTDGPLATIDNLPSNEFSVTIFD
jgi:hypothetical protein